MNSDEQVMRMPSMKEVACDSVCQCASCVYWRKVMARPCPRCGMYFRAGDLVVAIDGHMDYVHKTCPLIHRRRVLLEEWRVCIRFP